jgi:hypothetical protein
MKMFSATDSSSNRTVSWWIAVTPALPRPAAVANRTGARRLRIVPPVRLIDAGQDLDHGRLARAVLAHQGRDLARVKLERHVRRAR